MILIVHTRKRSDEIWGRGPRFRTETYVQKRCDVPITEAGPKH